MTIADRLLPAISPQKPTIPAVTPAPGLDEAVRAAVVLTALEPDVAASVLSGFSDSRIRNFARAMTRLGDMKVVEIDAILADFITRLTADGGAAGGEAEARRYLAAFMDNDGIDRLMTEIASPPRSVWARLEEVPDAVLRDWLALEHPQVAAVALTKISADKSARLLETFDPTMAQRVVVRMAHAPSASSEVVERIAEVIERDVLPQTSAAASQVKPANVIATVLNLVSGRVRDDIFAHMRVSSATLADDVRRLMFTFEDIPVRLEPRDVALVLKTVDDNELRMALKPDAEGPVAAFMLENITKRMADRLRQDLAEMPEPETASAEEAQSAVISAIVGLRDSGALTFRKPAAS